MLGLRFKKILGNLAHLRRQKKELNALEIYTKVAEEIAASEGGKHISKKSQRFLRILQKNLLGNFAINLEE